MSDPIRIVLVDDEAMVRVGLRMVLSGEPDLEVVGEASDGEEAVDVVQETRPDVVLMDIRMPRVDGIEGSRRVLAAAPDVKVVVLTTFDEDDYVEAALRSGRQRLPAQGGAARAAHRRRAHRRLRRRPARPRRDGPRDRVVRSARRRGPVAPRCSTGSPSASATCWR